MTGELAITENTSKGSTITADSASVRLHLLLPFWFPSLVHADCPTIPLFVVATTMLRLDRSLKVNVGVVCLPVVPHASQSLTEKLAAIMLIRSMLAP